MYIDMHLSKSLLLSTYVPFLVWFNHLTRLWASISLTRAARSLHSCLDLSSLYSFSLFAAYGNWAMMQSNSSNDGAHFSTKFSAIQYKCSL